MTDNDRELIELAAKAYGIHAKGWLNDKLIGFDTNTEWPVNGDWNPLEDDGDAFRLATRLSLLIDIIDGYSCAQALNVGLFSEEHNGNSFAATRRAIVRAAAEIGRGME